MVAYTLVVIALMLLPSTVTARPRFLYTAFPLLIAVAAVWPDDEEQWWALGLSRRRTGRRDRALRAARRHPDPRLTAP